jgi:hypothetical protein
MRRGDKWLIRGLKYRRSDLGNMKINVQPTTFHDPQ